MRLTRLEFIELRTSLRDITPSIALEYYLAKTGKDMITDWDESVIRNRSSVATQIIQGMDPDIWISN